MNLSLAWLDYILVAFYLTILVGLGWYFRRDQRTGDEFFLAGRSMRGWPLGLSLVATWTSVGGYTGIPGEAYTAGCTLLVIPLAVWCCWPWLTRTVVPLYYRLGIRSVYEYLELRYDARTRRVGSGLCVLWRFVWLGVVVYAPCKVLVGLAGLPLHPGWLVVILGTVTTLYTFLGGMRTVIWAAAMQLAVMGVGIILIVVTIWSRLDGGAGRVTEVASALGRAEVVDVSWRMSDPWALWVLIPHIVLTVLVLFVADQVTVQRYLAARSLVQARWSMTWACLGMTVMVPALLYTGLALLAFYHDNPQAARPIWVANVDHQTHQSVCDSRGTPLIAWAPQAITAENIDRLVADQRLLRPNTREPFLDVTGLIVSDAGAERVNVRQLAMRRPPPEGLQQGEMILNEQAYDELLPHFIASQTARGVTGWLVVAVLAASMCCFSAGIHALATLVAIDFRRPLTMRRRGREHPPAPQADVEDVVEERGRGRILVIVVGITATLLACGFAWWDHALSLVASTFSALAGPLLAVFLLGILTRRTTAAAALSTLLVGALFTSALAVATGGAACAGLCPGQLKLSCVWILPCSVVFSMTWGYLASFVLGRDPTRAKLRGLVVGLGALGMRGPDEASIAIPDSFDDAEDRGRAP